MNENSMHIEKHFFDTKKLLREIPVEDISDWLLNQGYFPERYVLPPSFQVSGFKLQKDPYNKDISDLTKRKIQTISYPKTFLNERKFGIIHPWNYHDIVYYLCENWPTVVDHLFHDEQKIFSYSFPIPVTSEKKGRVGHLRAGRMIYEWLQMAERDLIIDAGKFQYIVRTDIANFYSSIYTHTIPWALHGREEALKDKSFTLFGNKIDRLIQYSNDARTNGITVGSALSDLIAEIVLAAIDLEVSKKITDISFAAVRFKDNYRILCNSEKEGYEILQILSEELSQYNLVLNENKTLIFKLPDGLYRIHDREYFPYSLKKESEIDFNMFEHTLLIVLDIHRRNPGTNIIEKFLSELFDENNNLKIRFSDNHARGFQEIKKMIELLFFTKRESQKILCQVLSICDRLYDEYNKIYQNLKGYLRDKIEHEIKIASENSSTFEVLWYIFFSRFIQLGIKNFNSLIENEKILENSFYKTMNLSKQQMYNDSKIQLFTRPRKFTGKKLVSLTNVFD